MNRHREYDLKSRNTHQHIPNRQNHVAARPQKSGRQGAAFGPSGPHARQQLNGAPQQATGIGPHFWIRHKQPRVGDGFTIKVHALHFGFM